MFPRISGPTSDHFQAETAFAQPARPTLVGQFAGQWNSPRAVTLPRAPSVLPRPYTAPAPNGPAPNGSRPRLPSRLEMSPRPNRAQPDARPVSHWSTSSQSSDESETIFWDRSKSLIAKAAALYHRLTPATSWSSASGPSLFSLGSALSSESDLTSPAAAQEAVDHPLATPAELPGDNSHIPWELRFIPNRPAPPPPAPVQATLPVSTFFDASESDIAPTIPSPALVRNDLVLDQSALNPRTLFADPIWHHDVDTTLRFEMPSRFPNPKRGAEPVLNGMGAATSRPARWRRTRQKVASFASSTLSQLSQLRRGGR